MDRQFLYACRERLSQTDFGREMAAEVRTGVSDAGGLVIDEYRGALLDRLVTLRRVSPRPPSQIPASGTTAPGSYLEGGKDSGPCL